MSPRHIFLGLIVVTAGARAQSTTGDVRGRVTGDGNSLANVQVTATPAAMPVARIVRSGPDGVYILSALAPGRYTVRLSLIGRRPVELREIEVELGRTTGLADVTMEPASTQLSAVVVATPKATVDPVRTTIGTTLSSGDLAALPGERDYKSAIATVPHINTSYNGDPVNSAGASGLENMYFIDGVNVSTPFRGTGGTSLPYNFVKSVEVRSGGYEARYGRALGAIVNAVTYTGTNEFEASVFGFFTNSALAASPRALPSLKETSSAGYDVGVRVGGPVIRDQLWFSAAYNPRVTRADRVVGSFGTFPDRSRADIFAGKLTWQPRTSTAVELSVFGDPSTHHEVEGLSYINNSNLLNPDSYLHLVETGGISSSLRATTLLGNAILLEASAGLAASDENLAGDSPISRSEGAFTDNLTGAVGGGISFPSTVAQRRLTAALGMTVPAGRHTITVGAEYEDAGVRRALTNGGGIGSITRLATDSFLVHYEEVHGTFHNVVPVLFAQDAWRVDDRLTISAGFRWSRQTLSSVGYGTAQVFASEPQPRVGFSWMLDVTGARRLFGSYGRFYQEELLNLATLYYTDYLAIDKYYLGDPRLAGAQLISSQDFTSYAKDYIHSVDGASAESVHELTLGYEQLLGPAARLTARGVYRNLGTEFQQGLDPTRPPNLVGVLGTPGEGPLSFLPHAKREYTAAEFSADGTIGDVRYRASYVWSRNWGNYPGLFGSDLFYFPNPGVDYGFTLAFQGQNSTGYLPNDRPHAFKLSTAWSPTHALSFGSFFTWQSGTPLNDFGAADDVFCGGGCFPKFLVQRGTAGRTPSISDLNLRATYDTRAGGRARVQYVLDLLHVLNTQAPVRIDQQHYRGFDANGAQVNPNDGYLKPLRYQPGFTARLGVEVKY
jgi:hypothetical protein